jgi:hypothetical protein
MELLIAAVWAGFIWLLIRSSELGRNVIWLGFVALILASVAIPYISPSFR